MSPLGLVCAVQKGNVFYSRRDSNPQSSDPKSDALSITPRELIAVYCIRRQREERLTGTHSVFGQVTRAATRTRKNRKRTLRKHTAVRPRTQQKSKL